MARPRSEEARTRMLEAATEVVLDEGVHGFSVDEVARRSGVAKTTIYRHFPTRNELIVAAYDHAILEPPTPDTGSLRTDLVEFLTAVLPVFADERIRRTYFEIFTATARDPDLGRLHAEVARRRAGPTLTIFERAKARGEIADRFDYPTAFEIMEGPFIVRSILRPELMAEVDVEAVVDRILPLLRD